MVEPDLDTIRAELKQYGMPVTVQPGDITTADLLAMLPYQRTACIRWAEEHLEASGAYVSFEAYDEAARVNRRVWRKR